ncbi:hypothetical protein GQ54DRAFT_47183 [Martensiomyces pterosporus]|nr:hypothetical protein GQ54DRAFT_47183 [Martensiomyces pterosporus]
MPPQHPFSEGDGGTCRHSHIQHQLERALGAARCRFRVLHGSCASHLGRAHSSGADGMPLSCRSGAHTLTLPATAFCQPEQGAAWRIQALRPATCALVEASEVIAKQEASSLAYPRLPADKSGKGSPGVRWQRQALSHRFPLFSLQLASANQASLQHTA